MSYIKKINKCIVFISIMDAEKKPEEKVVIFIHTQLAGIWLNTVVDQGPSPIRQCLCSSCVLSPSLSFLAFVLQSNRRGANTDLEASRGKFLRLDLVRHPLDMVDSFALYGGGIAASLQKQRDRESKVRGGSKQIPQMGSEIQSKLILQSLNMQIQAKY